MVSDLVCLILNGCGWLLEVNIFNVMVLGRLVC